MTETTTFEGQQRAGLFRLPLIAEGGMPGAPTLHLFLGIDTVHDRASGFAEVTQALAQPVVCTADVAGPVIYETVMGPGSKIRIDLEGYPVIDWPKGGGVGPVIPKNFKATILLDTDWQKGEVSYQYQARNGEWVNPGVKPIHIADEQTSAAQVAAE
ncbi:DUF1842 domain-containing protein [Kordiimonas laminariae]|uniref:DUF1842 domain-containing protein n=1 Tax=Kordiimonas laminariae TaxID=2917717 RepID=UPI001FF292D4|nr:DUF1842 domain-containing protein [Kordiimonas laminariae]MCK0068453.1 DUF1842 domain-containing protein [Kordiimonas laminariae]